MDRCGVDQLHLVYLNFFKHSFKYTVHGAPASYLCLRPPRPPRNRLTDRCPVRDRPLTDR
eukprot:5432272-Prymnesium_polylepis.1